MFFYRLVLLGIFAALRQYDIEEWMNIKSISYPPFKCVFVLFTCMAPYLTWVQGSSGNWGINMFLYIVVDPEPEIHLDLPADYPPSDTDGIGKAVTVYILECRNVCPYLI